MTSSSVEERTAVPVPPGQPAGSEKPQAEVETGQKHQEDQKEETDEKARITRAARWHVGGLVIALVITTVAVTLYATTYVGSQPRAAVAGLLILYAAAASMAGALLGFLFGVPRSSVPGSRATFTSAGGDHTEPNTNLEQISDWLTKILVGATLVQLGNVGDFAARLFDDMARALDGSPMASALVGALVTYSVIAGFVYGWLTTRIWVGRLLDLLSPRHQTRRPPRRATTPPGTPGAPGAPGVP